MKRILQVCLLIFLLFFFSCTMKKKNDFYKSNPGPLAQNAYIKLPLGAVKPDGWLKSQLEAQAAGLTGNIDEFWPDLVSSSWRAEPEKHGKGLPIS